MVMMMTMTAAIIMNPVTMTKRTTMNGDNSPDDVDDDGAQDDSADCKGVMI